MFYRMFAYIIVYSVLVISCGFDTAKIALNKKINILLGLVCLFTLFRGLRWEVGTCLLYTSDAADD